MANATLAEDVYRRIKENIVTCQLLPGTPLKEQDLSDWLQVSRTPIREALRILESEGLVQIESRKGARVAQISRQDLLDAYEVRKWVESEAAAKVAQSISVELVSKLGATVDRIPVDPTTHEEAVAALEADLEFHRVIVDAAGNRLASLVVEEARALTRRAAYFVPPGRYGQSRQEHQAILQALEKQNAGLAKQLMREHLEAAAGRMFLLSNTPSASTIGELQEVSFDSFNPRSR